MVIKQPFTSAKRIGSCTNIFHFVMGAAIPTLIRECFLALCFLDALSEASTVPEWVRAPIVVGGSPGSGMVVATSILNKIGVYMVRSHHRYYCRKE